MRCAVSCGSTSFPWLVFFFRALLWGSMIHKHTRRWMWQGSASVISCRIPLFFFFNCSTTVRAHVVWATSWKRLLGQVRHLAVFSTASPANSYSQNSTSKFEIKLTGQFKSKSLIGSFCFDVLTLLVLPYGAMDKTKHVWRSWGMKRMTHQVIT